MPFLGYQTTVLSVHIHLHVLFRWLIAIAFWLSGGFIKSGLGNRIAYGIVSLFGKTTLGLTYSLVFAEALLAPAIPSVAARAGFCPFQLARQQGIWLSYSAQTLSAISESLLAANCKRSALAILNCITCDVQLSI